MVRQDDEMNNPNAYEVQYGVNIPAQLIKVRWDSQTITMGISLVLASHPGQEYVLLDHIRRTGETTQGISSSMTNGHPPSGPRGDRVAPISPHGVAVAE